MDRRPVPAKVTRPPPGEPFPRTRLFRRLDQARRRPLIWVMGPPGSGKTTLVSDYLQRRRLNTIWYQADPADTDVATFFHYLGIAAQKAAPRFRRALPQFSPDRQNDQEQFAREYFSELYARLRPPFAIVFDNYQEIPADISLHDLIRIAMEALPAQGTLIAISRKEPPPGLARARLNGMMAILDDADLQLTLEESQGIARQRLPERKARQQVSTLHELTHGWVAGLTLMLEQSQGELPEDAALFRTPGVLFEYFANEVFAKNDKDTQAVLLKSAFLPTMTVRTVAELTGERRAGRILNHLSRNNFFTIRYELPEPVFQYHPLFREFLLSRARRLPPDVLLQLRVRSASVLESNGAFESALSLYAEVDEWDGFERCLLPLAPRLLEQGRHQVLEQWLARVPEAHFEQQPWLMHYRGLCLLPMTPGEARQCFERAHALFRNTSDRRGLLNNWNHLIGSCLREGNDFHAISEWIEELGRILVMDASYPDSDIESDTVCTLFSAKLFSQPSDPELPSLAERIQHKLLTKLNRERWARTAPHLAMYYIWWRNDLPHAELLLRRYASDAASRDAQPGFRMVWHGIAAALHWALAENDQSVKEVDAALEIADSANLHATSPWLYLLGANAALHAGQVAQADSYLARLTAIGSGVREIDNIATYYLQAGRYFLQGDLPRSRQYLDQILPRCQETGFVLGQVYCMNDLARVIYLQGEHEDALDLLQQSRLTGLHIHNRCVEYLTWLTEAELSLLAGDEDRCQGALRLGLATGKSLHIQNHFWWRSEQMARLFSRALDHDIETEYVLGLIRKRALPPPEEARESSTWPFPYKLYTLGRFALAKDGQPLTFAGKAQSKPLDLLKALIALGSRQVSAAHLAELLWPDAEGDAAQRTFDTTLHRLRRLIGDDQVLLLSDGKLSLNPALCWVDVWTVERLMGKLDLFLKQPGSDNLHHDHLSLLANQLNSLYRGAFLARETNDPWAITLRERLQARYLCLLGALGRYWEACGDWERAAETYHKTIDTHAEGEEFYQRLMLVYRHLGRPAEAATVYQRCRETLLATTGRPLSPATEALYQQLVSITSSR